MEVVQNDLNINSLELSIHEKEMIAAEMMVIWPAPFLSTNELVSWIEIMDPLDACVTYQ